MPYRCRRMTHECGEKRRQDEQHRGLGECINQCEARANSKNPIENDAACSFHLPTSLVDELFDPLEFVVAEPRG